MATESVTADEEVLAQLLLRARHQSRSLDVRAALKTVVEALPLARRLRDQRALAEAFGIATTCHYYRGDVVAAAATGLDAFMACPASDYGERSRALQSVALALLAAEDFRRAQDASRHALQEAARGHNAVAIGNSRNLLGMVLGEIGRFEEAFKEFRLARAQFRKLGDGERGSAVAVNLGHALRRQGIFAQKAGDPAGAARLWRRACKVYRAAIDSGRPRVGRILVQSALADCEMRLGHDDEARILLAGASGDLRAGDPPRITARVSWMLGESERRLGHRSDARRHLEKAIELAIPATIDNVAFECQGSLSRLATELGKKAEAKRWRESAKQGREKRRRALIAIRRDMRPLWDRYLRHAPE